MERVVLLDYILINKSIINTYQVCEIRSFPLNCFDILKQYKIDVHSYSSLNEKLREYCMKYSNDALKYRDKICYNDSLPLGRIRFSLMHELGHIVLNHIENRTYEMEQEANYFASHILAPRIAIHYSKCKNENDVAKQFGLTIEAAQYAFENYRRWHRWTVYHKMNEYDKEMYTHFYNKEANCFVYSIKRCAYCDTEIYNSTNILCKKCNQITHIPPEYDQDLMIAESQWLYGGL